MAHLHGLHDGRTSDGATGGVFILGPSSQAASCLVRDLIFDHALAMTALGESVTYLALRASIEERPPRPLGDAGSFDAQLTIRLGMKYFDSLEELQYYFCRLHEAASADHVEDAPSLGTMPSRVVLDLSGLCTLAVREEQASRGGTSAHDETPRNRKLLAALAVARNAIEGCDTEGFGPIEKEGRGRRMSIAWAGASTSEALLCARFCDQRLRVSEDEGSSTLSVRQVVSTETPARDEVLAARCVHFAETNAGFRRHAGPQ